MTGTREWVIGQVARWCWQRLWMMESRHLLVMVSPHLLPPEMSQQSSTVTMMRDYASFVFANPKILAVFLAVIYACAKGVQTNFKNTLPDAPFAANLLANYSTLEPNSVNTILIAYVSLDLRVYYYGYAFCVDI